MYDEENVISSSVLQRQTFETRHINIFKSVECVDPCTILQFRVYPFKLFKIFLETNNLLQISYLEQSAQNYNWVQLIFNPLSRPIRNNFHSFRKLQFFLQEQIVLLNLGATIQKWQFMTDLEWWFDSEEVSGTRSSSTRTWPKGLLAICSIST